MFLKKNYILIKERNTSDEKIWQIVAFQVSKVFGAEWLARAPWTATCTSAVGQSDDSPILHGMKTSRVACRVATVTKSLNIKKNLRQIHLHKFKHVTHTPLLVSYEYEYEWRIQTLSWKDSEVTQSTHCRKFAEVSGCKSWLYSVCSDPHQKLMCQPPCWRISSASSSNLSPQAGEKHGLWQVEKNNAQSTVAVVTSNTFHSLIKFQQLITVFFSSNSKNGYVSKSGLQKSIDLA